MKSKSDLIFIILLIIISFLTVFDLFVNVGRSANMDGLVHITTIAQFYQALKGGEFPVIWAAGFANYGLPLGIFAHQLPTYLGAFINFLVHDPVLSFNIVSLIAILFSNIFFYIFLRLYYSPLIALTATFLFNFAPYRIVNLYIRGAIPETLSAVFLPLIMIALYYLIKKRRFFAIPLLILSVTALALTHPMMLLISTFIFIPYMFFALIGEKDWLRLLMVCFFFMALGVAMASYYYIPLTREIKYFYYGQSKNQLVPNQFLSARNYFDPNWYYFMEERNDIINRGHFITPGILEIAAVIVGALFILKKALDTFVRRKASRFKITLLEPAVGMSLVIIFLTLKYSEFIYLHFNLLSNIQFPWRMFAAFIFLPPLIYAYFLDKVNNKVLMIILILIVCLIRFPQLYGKNYTAYPQSTYFFTPINLHSTNMNTIWTGKTEDYPIKKNKGEIAQGKGKILSSDVKNSSRVYKVKAESELLMTDNTFYFPGWKVYIDGKATTIEFQDPNYRGVITYHVGSGTHTILVRFEDTKIRLLGKIVSVITFIFFLVILFAEKRFKYVSKLLSLHAK